MGQGLSFSLQTSVQVRLAGNKNSLNLQMNIVSEDKFPPTTGRRLNPWWEKLGRRFPN